MPERLGKGEGGTPLSPQERRDQDLKLLKAIMSNPDTLSGFASYPFLVNITFLIIDLVHNNQPRLFIDGAMAATWLGFIFLYRRFNTPS